MIDLFSKKQDRLHGPLSPPFHRYLGFSPHRSSGWVMQLTFHLSQCHCLHSTICAQCKLWHLSTTDVCLTPTVHVAGTQTGFSPNSLVSACQYLSTMPTCPTSIHPSSAVSVTCLLAAAVTPPAIEQDVHMEQPTLNDLSINPKTRSIQQVILYT